MQYFLLYILMAVFFSLAVSGCDKKETMPPECLILSPKSNSKVVAGKTIKITVSAKSKPGGISQLGFYADGIALALLKTQPYDFYWETENFSIGVHTLKVVAFDHSGLSSGDEIQIEIVPYIPVTEITDARDGNIYQVAEIGEQVWMTENLRYIHEYSAIVNNNSNLSQEYGLLYMTRLGTGEDACPDGWHIPSPDEWEKLFAYLGGKSVAGGKLKEAGTDRWKSPNTGATNSSGFSARPAGYLTRDYIPDAFGSSACFFTALYGNYIILDYNSDSVRILKYHPSNEFYSVRCVRDY